METLRYMLFKKTVELVQPSKLAFSQRRMYPFATCVSSECIRYMKLFFVQLIIPRQRVCCSALLQFTAVTDVTVTLRKHHSYQQIRKQYSHGVTPGDVWVFTGLRLFAFILFNQPCYSDMGHLSVQSLKSISYSNSYDLTINLYVKHFNSQRSLSSSFFCCKITGSLDIIVNHSVPMYFVQGLGTAFIHNVLLSSLLLNFEW